MGGAYSYESHLGIKNDTSTSINLIQVSGIFENDWDGSGRPDKNFNGENIVPGGYKEYRQELRNSSGKGQFTMKLIFSNGLIDMFSACQKYAIDKSFEGCFNHIQCAHIVTHECFPSKKLLKITISNTQLQIDNEKAENLAKDVKKDVDKKQYLQTLQKIEYALKFANEKGTIEKLHKLKSTCFFELGKIDMKKGLELEDQSKSEEAMKKFEKAKEYFQESQSLGFIDSTLNIDFLYAKITGSKLFNEAIILDEKALKLFNENPSTQDNNIVAQIKNTYQQALDKYEEAKKYFENGAKLSQLHGKMIAKSIEIVNEAIDNVKPLLQDAIANELDVNFTNMYIDNPKTDQAVVDNQEEIIVIEK